MSAFGGKAEAVFAESQESPVNRALLAMFTVGLRRRVCAAGYAEGYAVQGFCSGRPVSRADRQADAGDRPSRRDTLAGSQRPSAADIADDGPVIQTRNRQGDPAATAKRLRGNSCSDVHPLSVMRVVQSVKHCGVRMDALHVARHTQRNGTMVTMHTPFYKKTEGSREPRPALFLVTGIARPLVVASEQINIRDNYLTGNHKTFLGPRT
jgi:hypothetical protein